MTREIKFRYWDNKWKKMRPITNIECGFEIQLM